MKLFRLHGTLAERAFSYREQVDEKGFLHKAQVAIDGVLA